MVAIMILLTILVGIYHAPAKIHFKEKPAFQIECLAKTIAPSETINIRLTGSDAYLSSSSAQDNGTALLNSITPSINCSIKAISWSSSASSGNTTVYLLTLGNFSGEGELKITMGAGTLTDRAGATSVAQTLRTGIRIGYYSYEYNYKGYAETFQVPYTGTYKFEVWGASGNTPEELAVENCGYGGYSTGDIRLEKGTTLFINVGGQGENGIATIANRRL